MELKWYLFDYKGSALTWLKDQSIDSSFVCIPANPPGDCCWVRTLFQRRLACDKCSDEPDFCLAEASQVQGPDALWVIHDNREGHDASAIEAFQNQGHPVPSAPRALVFVSRIGGKGYFEDKRATTVSIYGVPGAGSRELPVFHLRDGLAVTGKDLLISVLGHICSALGYPRGDDPLDQFRKEALDSDTKEWADAIGLYCDDKDLLFMLLAITRLTIDGVAELSSIKNRLLADPRLQLAAQAQNLDQYLEGLHSGGFIPISCQSAFVRAPHQEPRKCLDENDKGAIVNRWFEDHRQEAERKGLLESHWKQIKDMVVHDLNKSAPH